MPEAGGKNIEIAEYLNEPNDRPVAHGSARVHLAIEMIEALLLAVVAITTAWSGYQAARWDSLQSVLYGQASRLRVEGQTLEEEANQLKQYHAATVVEWLKAEAHGETALANLFERRLTRDFRPAFEAWKKTDPLHNPNAPPGPFVMPEYQDSRTRLAADKSQKATELFEQGTLAREHADGYVRVTVFLATVLLLTAIGQRFHSHRIRVVLAMIALLVLCVPLWQLFHLPRI